MDLNTVKEITNKDEMKMKLFTYHKLIDGIDDIYNSLSEGSPKKDWIDGSWKEICNSLVEHFEMMVEDSLTEVN